MFQRFLGKCLIYLSILCLMPFVEVNSASNMRSDTRSDVGVGQYSKLPLPRYASMRSGNANMRNGPSKGYPILWTYKYRGMPVRIVAEHENWRKIETFDGAQGWFHVSLLSSVRTVLFDRHEKYKLGSIFVDLPSDQTILFRKPSYDSFPIARIQNNTIAKLIKCDNNWCKVKLKRLQGWVSVQNLWGIESGEIFK